MIIEETVEIKYWVYQDLIGLFHLAKAATKSEAIGEIFFHQTHLENLFADKESLFKALEQKGVSTFTFLS